MLSIQILTYNFFRLNRELEKCQDKLISKDQFPESGGYMRVQGIVMLIFCSLNHKTFNNCMLNGFEKR